MEEVSPINISLTQHSPSLSVLKAISPTLTEEFIIHPSVYTEIKKISYAKSYVLLKDTPSPMERKHSRFAMLRRFFKPWKWKRKKKSDRFEQTSRTLERKISMRSTKEELIKKGVLMPDGTDKDQDRKINDSVHQNHIPQINGFGPESGMSETEKQRNSPSVTYTSSSVLETYNNVVVTNSTFPTVLSSSQNHAMPVIHNVSLLNLPDVEEVPSHDGEIVFSVLLEPPISLNVIEPIQHHQHQTT
ncbi:phosphatase and actin regulator 2 [Trichonephila clavipes]|nr:phosphatase and actin regulator 2 [Trichonephila clavipes]